MFSIVGVALYNPALHPAKFMAGAGGATRVRVGLFCDGLILGYLMYRSGLVPRGLAMLGLLGGTLLCVSGVQGIADPGRRSASDRRDPLSFARRV